MSLPQYKSGENLHISQDREQETGGEGEEKKGKLVAMS